MTDYSLTVTEDERARFEAAASTHVKASNGVDDLIITHGLRFLEEAETQAWSSREAADLVKRLAQRRAMLQRMLVEVVILKRRFLDVEAQREREVERTPKLEAEFRALQARAVKLDRRLLDLRLSADRRDGA